MSQDSRPSLALLHCIQLGGLCCYLDLPPLSPAPQNVGGGGLSDLARQGASARHTLLSKGCLFPGQGAWALPWLGANTSASPPASRTADRGGHLRHDQKVQVEAHDADLGAALQI